MLDIRRIRRTILLAAAGVMAIALVFGGGYVTGHHTQAATATPTTAFEQEIDALLARPAAHPRTGRMKQDGPIVLLNWGSHAYGGSAHFPIGAVTAGQRVEEIGPFSDGRILVCYTYDGLRAAARCGNGAAFLAKRSDITFE